jgi:hypothetical protein
MMIFLPMSLGTCENFVSSLDDYATEVIGIGYDFHTPVVYRSDGTLMIPPGDEERVSRFTVKLRNPRNYALSPRLNIEENRGIYMTCSSIGGEKVVIRIQGAARGESYHLELTLRTEDRERTFAPYILPDIWCYSFSTGLKEITLSAGALEPQFDPAVKEYRVEVDYEVNEIAVQGIPEDEKAVVSGDGTKTLEVGDTRFTLTVKAENGVNIGEYIVTVRRKPRLTVKAGGSIRFIGVREDRGEDVPLGTWYGIS